MTAGTVSAASWVVRDGRHIRLVTDLPDSDQLSDLIAAFDAAVPQWAEYFGHDDGGWGNWRVTAYLMSAKEPFVAAGHLPESLPDFRFGFQSGNRVWVFDQPTEYYTRHLLLHEGVHAFSSHLFGGCGPPWFMEGVAEYLSTHHWPRGYSVGDKADAAGADRTNRGGAADRLRSGVVPADPEASAGWGRIDMIATARQQQRVPRIETVMRFGETAHRQVEAYAWSWLVVTLLEMYSEYREPFRESATRAADSSPQFTRIFYDGLRDRWPVLTARWRLLTQDIDYGFDPVRHRVELPNEFETLTSAGVAIGLDTARGWQAAPIRVVAGESVEVTANGFYTIRQPADGESDTAWKSGPEGVTIQYYRGRPLGQLIGCFLPLRVDGDLPNQSPLEVVGIADRAKLTATVDSWLLLKINEAPGDLDDNRGTIEVRVSPAD